MDTVLTEQDMDTVLTENIMHTARMAARTVIMEEAVPAAQSE